MTNQVKQTKTGRVVFNEERKLRSGRMKKILGQKKFPLKLLKWPNVDHKMK